jgi:hypothetical protein
MIARDLHPVSRKVLRAIATHAPVTLQTLNELRELDAPRFGFRNVVARLCREQLAEICGHDGARHYRATDKGRRLLATIDTEEDAAEAGGQVAAPRERPIGGHWQPPADSPPARAGSMHAVTLPSLRGTQRVPHRPPISMGSTAAPRKPQ